MLPVTPPPAHAAEYGSPRILDAMLRPINLDDRLKTERWEGAKRSLDAGLLGAPPLFRRAFRGFLKGRYEQAALIVPALALYAVGVSASLGTLPTMGLLNEKRHKPRSLEAVWEHRLCLAIKAHSASSWWGIDGASIAMERKFLAWVKDELQAKPDRARYSEKIWWQMRGWSRQLSMREKMLAP